MKKSSFKEFILDLLFPKFCLVCGKEEDYLCLDCFSLIDIAKRQYCPFCFPPKPVADGKTCDYHKRTKTLKGLFCPASYDNFIVKNLINQFKYHYVKDLAKPISDLIIAHFVNLESLPTKKNDNIILIPVPLYRKKLKQRGFNQAEEIAKELSKSLKIPLFSNVLSKIKPTLSQVGLKQEQREENIKGVFFCQNPEIIKDKTIFLVDDIFTTGSTMEECAKTLKQAKAKEIWGIAAARSANIKA